MECKLLEICFKEDDPDGPKTSEKENYREEVRGNTKVKLVVGGKRSRCNVRFQERIHEVLFILFYRMKLKSFMTILFHESVLVQNGMFSQFEAMYFCHIYSR